MEPWVQATVTIVSSVLASSGLWAYLSRRSDQKDVKTGAIQIPEHEFIPLLMHYNHDSRTYGIYKLNDYTQELADQHTANERNPGEFSISYYKELFEQIKAKGNGDEI